MRLCIVRRPVAVEVAGSQESILCVMRHIYMDIKMWEPVWGLQGCRTLPFTVQIPRAACMPPRCQSDGNL